jgi:glycosyltransferase involved in cell wall biosynthesis
MKILFDPQIFYQQRFGGISRYYAEVISVLKTQPGVEAMLPLGYNENFHAQELALSQESRMMRSLFKTLASLNISSRSLQGKRAKKLLDRAVQHFRFGLYVPTYYDTSFLQRISGKPFVLTVYDMIHELFPEYYVTQSLTIVQDKLLLMEKAAKIIAISHSTKADIIRLYPQIPASRIEVVHLASSISLDAATKPGLPEKYVLFVGERANYKNFATLLTAMVPLLEQDPLLVLLCAGGNSFKEEEKVTMKRLGVEKQVMQLPFKENELANFYANACCFVFPSLYEGFGIPVLEAMRCGCPVVLGNHSSFTEVAGDAGVYADVRSADDLQNKIGLLLTNNTARHNFAAKGLVQAARFSWRTTAEQCLQVYEAAIREQS